jgi:CHAT domain-containing protein
MSEALASAQRWLRDLPAAQAHGIVNTMEKQGLGAPEAAEAHHMIDTFAPTGEAPFRHPFWWAAFQAVGGASS